MLTFDPSPRLVERLSDHAKVNDGCLTGRKGGDELLGTGTEIEGLPTPAYSEQQSTPTGDVQGTIAWAHVMPAIPRDIPGSDRLRYVLSAGIARLLAALHYAERCCVCTTLTRYLAYDHLSTILLTRSNRSISQALLDVFPQREDAHQICEVVRNSTDLFFQMNTKPRHQLENDSIIESYNGGSRPHCGMHPVLLAKRMLVVALCLQHLWPQ